MDDVLKLNCVHEMYQTSILLQQINYAVLEEKYNELSGKTLYIKEDTDQKKQSIFSKIITTLKTWIGKLVTFITKTIPNWIKRQIEKISNIFKRRGNAKVVNTEKLPEKHKAEVKKLANSANKVTKNARKIEEIKSELKSSEDGSSYLVDSLKKMNAEMQRQTNAAMDDLDNTKYNAAMNITNRHAELYKLLDELEEKQKENKKDLEEIIEDMEELADELESKKHKENQKKQDQTDKDLDDLLNFSGSSSKTSTAKTSDDISKELDSILDDIKDAVDKKEDVVVVEKPNKSTIMYRYANLGDFERDSELIIRFFNEVANDVSRMVKDIDSLKAMDIIDNKVLMHARGGYSTIEKDLTVLTKNISDCMKNYETISTFKSSRQMPKIEYQKIQIPKGLSNDAIKSLQTALTKLNSFSSDEPDINEYKNAGIKQITAMVEYYNKIVSEYSKFLMFRIKVYTKAQQDIRIEIRDDL